MKYFQKRRRVMASLSLAAAVAAGAGALAMTAASAAAPASQPSSPPVIAAGSSTSLVSSPSTLAGPSSTPVTASSAATSVPKGGSAAAPGTSQASATRPQVAATATGVPSLPAGATVIVASAWLGASEVPGDGTLHWHGQGTPTATSDARRLQQDLWTPWCGGLSGFTSRQQSAISGDGHAAGQQYLFTFPTADAAHAAYQKIAGSRIACGATWAAGQAQSGLKADSVISPSASAATASAWTWRWTGFATPMTQAGPQADHEYLLQRGPMLSIVDLVEPLSTHDTPSAVTQADDAQALRAMTAHLCGAYPSACR